MRNITAKELGELVLYHYSRGNTSIAIAYEKEEEELQMEMNRD